MSKSDMRVLDGGMTFLYLASAEVCEQNGQSKQVSACANPKVCGKICMDA